MKNFSQLFRCITVIVLSALTLNVPSFSNEPPKNYGAVEIIRDTWGIPHIFSDSDRGALYGLGYASAEDRTFQMYYSLRVIQGRVSEILGNVGKNNTTSVEEDKKMRTMGFYRAAKKIVPNLDKETVSLLQAYSDGVNDYITNNQNKLIYLFQKYNIQPELWTPADCIAVWWHFAQFFSGDGTREYITYRNRINSTSQPPTAQRGRTAIQLNPSLRIPPDDTGAVIQRQDVTDEWIKKTVSFMKKYKLDRLDSAAAFNTPIEPEIFSFSHAWVVGGKKTTTGSIVLNSDPQTPVRNPSQLYEFHICGKTFNARGTGVAGSPLILIGWNEYVAWGVTALGADQADLFILKTDSTRPNQYFFDKKWRNMNIVTETILVKNSSQIPFEIKETHFGPVISAFAFLLPGEPDVALKRIPIAESNRETIQAAFAMMRARNVHQFSKALENWRFPSINILFGDKSGDIGYRAAGALPIRSSAAFSNGNEASPGSESIYDWQGIIPPELLPNVINPSRGYILSANNRPIGSFYPIPLGTSTGSFGDTGRSWRLRELLEQKHTFAPEDVLAIHYDSVNPIKRDIVSIGFYLRDVQKAPLSQDAQMALQYLERWIQNPSSDLLYEGAALINVIATNFRILQTDLTQIYGGGENGLCFFLKSVNSQIKNNLSAVLTQQEISFIESTLANAWNSAQNQYGAQSRFRTSPEQWNTAALNQTEKRVLGYFVNLDGYPSLDTANDIFLPRLTCTDGGTIKSQASQAYSQWVPLHRVDSARSILPIGLSENISNPFRLSTYDLWTDGSYHPAPLTKIAVKQYAVSSQVLSK